MYIAKNEHWTCNFGDKILHKWTIGNEYEISLSDEDLTITINSDNGCSTVNVMGVSKQLMIDVFGIDIQYLIDSYNEMYPINLPAEV